MNKFDAIFKDLEAINNESIVDLYLPASASTKKFKPISVLQQKQIISNMGGNPLDNIRIINILNGIISDNCCDDDKSSITTFDREFVLLNLKIDEEMHSQVEDINAFARSIDANKTCSKVASFNDAIVVQMHVPSLMRDSAFNSWFIDNNKNSQHSASELASNYFILEIIKHIKSIAIKNEIVEFNDVADAASYVKIAEHLPAYVNNAVAKFITNVKEIVEQAFADKKLNTQTPLF